MNTESKVFTQAPEVNLNIMKNIFMSRHQRAGRNHINS
jgi:hypothetical protein